MKRRSFIAMLAACVLPWRVQQPTYPTIVWTICCPDWRIRLVDDGYIHGIKRTGEMSFTVNFK